MIMGYVGIMGEGKTLSLVADLVKPLLSGKKIYSNFPFFIPARFPIDLNNPNFVYDQVNNKTYYAPTYLEMSQFSSAVRKERNCIFAIDEASLLLSNYFWQSIDQNLIYRLSQSRKIGIDILPKGLSLFSFDIKIDMDYKSKSVNETK